MRLGIAIKDTWRFFEEIYAEFAAHHQTSIFDPDIVSPPFFKNRIENYFYRRNLQKFLQKNDVVFFEWASSLLVTASHLAKTCGIVTRLHRYEMYEFVDHVNWEVVDKIILVSKAKQQEFSERFPKHAHKVVIIPEGVSVSKFQFRTKPFNGDIGTLCHITPRKRVYELILSYYELLNRNDNFHLHIGGGKKPKYPDYYEAVHKLVDRLNIQGKVTFYDQVDDASDWYANIDIFVSNSYSEGLQVSPIEAMASGCFCISHFWPGAEELIPQENLFTTNSEMINLIIRYSECTDAEKERLQEQMRHIVSSQFNIDNIKSKIRLLIEDVKYATKN